MSVVTKITKRVANTKFVQRAAEKVSSYPLTLTVEVKQLDGILAVNIPPPPSDTIWYVTTYINLCIHGNDARVEI